MLGLLAERGREREGERGREPSQTNDLAIDQGSKSHFGRVARGGEKKVFSTCTTLYCSTEYRENIPRKVDYLHLIFIPLN